MREGDAGGGQGPRPGGHARDDLEGDPGPGQGQRFLAPPPEHGGVAPLEAHHGAVAASPVHQQVVGALLAAGVAVAGAHAHVHHLGPRGGESQEARVDQGVVEDHVRPLQEGGAPPGEELGIAGAGAHQVHGAHVTSTAGETRRAAPGWARGGSNGG